MMHYDNEPERAMHGAEAVAHFLDRKHASYELIEHHATYAAQQEASAAGSAAPRMAKTVVLHDIDLTIQPGQLVGLVGGTGSVTAITTSELVILGLGTTLGIAAQTAILVPSLRRRGRGWLRAFDPRRLADRPATLRALRTRFAGCRLWAILEPRSNTLRRNVFQQELVESLANADEVVMASVYFKPSDALGPEERLDVDAVVAELGRRGRRARQFADADAIVSGIAGELRGGDVVAILSNGGFGGIYEKLPARLRQRSR